MVTTLYIVRHCQSAGNLSGRFQGRFDAPVSETGEKQLELLSLLCHLLPAACPWTSHLLSLTLSALICKVEAIFSAPPSIQGCWETKRKGVKTEKKTIDM